MMQRLFVRPTKKALRKIGQFFRWDLDAFLRHASGVIHVGANAGQERARYARYGLDVAWIEPIPEVFARLQTNLRGFPRQQAYQYLVTDTDGQRYEFHVANNEGASSSILDLGLHRDIWPTVHYERTLVLESITLASLVQRERIDMERFDALILDTQGSELLVLKGASSLLPRFRFIKIEVPDFESYAGCCQLRDVQAFLASCGFQEHAREQFAAHPHGGGYYDVLYQRAA
jgi:FkbM family methyltransferase